MIARAPVVSPAATCHKQALHNSIDHMHLTIYGTDCAHTLTRLAAMRMIPSGMIMWRPKRHSKHA